LGAGHGDRDGNDDGESRGHDRDLECLPESDERLAGHRKIRRKKAAEEAANVGQVIEVAAGTAQHAGGADDRDDEEQQGDVEDPEALVPF
jgi:hypothetical protein